MFTLVILFRVLSLHYSYKGSAVSVMGQQTNVASSIDAQARYERVLRAVRVHTRKTKVASASCLTNEQERGVALTLQYLQRKTRYRLEQVQAIMSISRTSRCGRGHGVATAANRAIRGPRCTSMHGRASICTLPCLAPLPLPISLSVSGVIALYPCSHVVYRAHGV